MDRAHMIAAEKILEISRNGRESSAVHADQHPRDQDKKRDGIQVLNFRKRKRQVKQHAHNKKDEVGGLASDEVRHRRPDKTTSHVEEAQQTHKTSRRDRRDTPA